MPYKSDAQRKFFHTDTAKKKGITGAMVKEYDSASKGKSLPDKVVQNVAKRATKKTKLNSKRSDSGLDTGRALGSVMQASKKQNKVKYGPRDMFNMPHM